MRTASDIERLIHNYKKKITICNEQIQRLEPVYKALKEHKESFRTAYRPIEKTLDDGGAWCGTEYGFFCRQSDAVVCSCKKYYDQLDVALDAVNTKIGQLRAEKNRLIPIIGNLAAQLEALRTHIENQFN